jgi:Animal haem peroxidase
MLSIDIQRCRDHGLLTFLDARRMCGFIANFKTFDDLIAIFPQSYIKLLKNVYDSVEDIELYVGGSLETLYQTNNFIVGETFRCIIGELMNH